MDHAAKLAERPCISIKHGCQQLPDLSGLSQQSNSDSTHSDGCHRSMHDILCNHRIFETHLRPATSVALTLSNEHVVE